MLTQTRERDVQVVGIHIHAVTAGEVIELLLDLSSRQILGTHHIEIVAHHIIAVVVLMTELIAEGQGKQAVSRILHIEQRQALYFFTFYPFYL